MKHKFLLYFLLFFIFSSCIEIEEKVSIHQDLSGQISYTIKTSKLGSFISGVIDKRIEAQIKIEADKLIEKLKMQPGIENVQYELNPRNHIYYVQFDFDRAESFNKALYAMGDSKKTFFTPGYLHINRCRVKKINFSKYVSFYLKKEGIEIPNDFITQMLTFKSIIEVPEEIKKTKGLGTVISTDRKSVTQKFLVNEIIQQKINTRLKVRY